MLNRTSKFIWDNLLILVLLSSLCWYAGYVASSFWMCFMEVQQEARSVLHVRTVAQRMGHWSGAE